MIRTTSALATLLSLATAACLGCSNLGKGHPKPFLKPLTGPVVPQIGSSSRSEAELCLETAEAVASKGHAKEAILLYERVEQLSPNDQSLDLALAPLYAQVGQTDKATQRYRSVIARGSAAPEVYNNLAWTLLESAEHAEADWVIQQGLAEHPNNVRLQSSQAVLAYKLGNRESAFSLFDELYGPGAAHHNLAVLDIEHGKLDTALNELDHAMRSSDSPSASAELSRALRAELARDSRRL